MFRTTAVYAALRAFVNQRPGLEFGNYGDVRAYRSESRRITRDRDDALFLLAYAEKVGIDADAVIAATRGTRLALVEKPDGAFRVDYVTGQYFCVEYRPAVASLIAGILWHRYADGQPDTAYKTARNLFGTRLARRWFK